MILSRSFAGFLSSSGAKRWRLLSFSYTFHPHSYPCDRLVRAYGKSLRTPAKPALYQSVEAPSPKIRLDPPRPNLIPFQAKVANSVHLVGTIDTVYLHQFTEESYASASILVNENVGKPDFFSQFSIPIIFRGYLAEIASCHLKKNDLIYVSGQLSGDNLPFTQKDAKENIKLIAYSLNFVKEASWRNRGQLIEEEASTSDSGDMKISNDAFKVLWDELLIDSKNWFDNRELKLKGLFSIKSPDFVQKETGRALWLDGAPDWVLPRLEGLEFRVVGNLAKINCKGDMKKSDDAFRVLWDELLIDPKNWFDNREAKLKGLFSAKFPDFVQKETRRALWLNNAPDWVLPRLEGLKFNVMGNLTKINCEGDMKTSDGALRLLWDELLIDPKNWFDNREMKLKGLFSTKFPDFVQKEIGHALWLNIAPDWVLPRLEGLEFSVMVNLAKINCEGDMKISDDAFRVLWDELLVDPKNWLDNREVKLKGLFSTKFPDFVQKETGHALWMHSAPDWVLPRLEGLEFIVMGNLAKINCKDYMWKKFVENPKEWWDNRLSKTSEKAPDFKHKDDGEALWLNSAPTWALPMLPPLPATEKNDTVK